MVKSHRSPGPRVRLGLRCLPVTSGWRRCSQGCSWGCRAGRGPQCRARGGGEGACVLGGSLESEAPALGYGLAQEVPAGS